MMRRLPLPLLACLLAGVFQYASAQDEPVVPSEPIIPKELTAYADVDQTLKNAGSVISLLGVAQIERWTDEYESDGKKVQHDNGLTAHCDTPNHQTFYRGMHLAHAGYYLFLAKQEVGWFEYASPVGDYGQPRRKFVGFGRGVLVGLWRPERVADIHRLVSELGRLPPDRRKDLAAYLSELRAYRLHVANLIERAEGKLRDLLRRGAGEYFYEELYNSAASNKNRDSIPNDKKALIYDELSDELRKLINSTRDPDTVPISDCMVMGSAFRMKFGVASLIVSEKIFVPVKYMVGFWLRRRAEGLERLTDFVLSQAVNTLKTGEATPRVK
jgi:hypothetical protein